MLRLADQQMNVFRHDHIAGDVKAVLAAGLFQRLLKQALGQGAGQPRLPTIAAEGDEVQVARLLVPLQSPRHERSIHLR